MLRLLACSAVCLCLCVTAHADLEAAWQYSRAHDGISLMVIRNGRVLLERYEPGAGPRTLHKIYSGTKAFWCVASLAAQADGLLNLNEPVGNAIPEWRNDARGEITIRELLDFTGGLDPGFHLHSDDVADRNAYALALPRVAPRGSAFIYGPGQLQVFCEVLRRRLAARNRETPWNYLQRRVLGPAGLSAPPHKVDALGEPLLATGMQLTARQWARWGNCLLDGAPGVLSKGSLAQSLRGSSVNPAFGLGFWLNHEAPGGRALNIEQNLEPKWWRQDWRGACVCREAPPDLFVSLGSMGQRLYIIPSMRMVVVRISADSKFWDEEFLRLLLAGS